MPEARAQGRAVWLARLCIAAVPGWNAQCAVAFLA
jgi:hypothetical protein